MSEHDEDHKKESNPVGETEASGKKKMSQKKKAGIAGIVILAVLLDIMQRQIMSATRKLPGR